MSTTERAREIISRIRYMTLATVSDIGEPWNAPVFYSYSAPYFYWGSYRNAQHSKNIRANGRVYIVIFDSTVKPGAGEGVYIRAQASEVTDEEEVRDAHKILWDRHEVPYWKLEQFDSIAPIRIYKATPEVIWMNGEGRVDGHYVDKRDEITLI